MDVAKIFAKEPPVEPLTTLSAIVRDWRMRTAPGGGLDTRRDEVVEFCREAPDLPTAVRRAVNSRRPNGKMHNHQTKVPRAARERLGEKMIAAWTPDLGFMSRTDFDRLYDEVRLMRPKGIGPVTTYDVTVRVAAFFDTKPQSLYLHAGVEQGWDALRTALGRLPFLFPPGAVKRLSRAVWPEAVRSFEADDLEDFLCTYRSILGSVSGEW